MFSWALLFCLLSWGWASQSALTFLHLTDVHLNPLYNPSSDWSNGVYCRGEPYRAVANTSYGYYGRYLCDPPAVLYESMLACISTVETQPAFVVLGGDLAAHHLPTATLVLQSFSEVLKGISNLYPKVPTAFTLGNNDFFPRYSVNASMTNWLTQLAPVLDGYGYFPTPAAKQDFTSYGYYAFSIAPLGIKIISLNTIIFSPYFSPNPPLPGCQQAHISWLANQLSDAEQQTQSVFIIGHLPPITLVWRNESQWDTQWVNLYYKTITPFANIIKGQFFSHTHRDTFSYRTDPTSSKPLLPLLATPALSPDSETNPSFRTYILARTPNAQIEVIDYLQYYADLLDPQTLQTGYLSWKLEYNFTSAYGEKDLTANSLADLLRKLKYDPQLYNLWKARFAVSFDVEKWRFFCSIEANSQQEYQKCIGSEDPVHDWGSNK